MMCACEDNPENVFHLRACRDYTSSQQSMPCPAIIIMRSIVIPKLS